MLAGRRVGRGNLWRRYRRVLRRGVDVSSGKQCVEGSANPSPRASARAWFCLVRHSNDHTGYGAVGSIDDSPRGISRAVERGDIKAMSFLMRPELGATGARVNTCVGFSLG